MRTARSQPGPAPSAGLDAADSPSTNLDAAEVLAKADALATHLGERIERASAVLGRAVTVDGPAELRARATLDGVPAAGGCTSPRGGTQLLPCADGWVALSLARASDRASLPALLALAGGPTVDRPFRVGLAGLTLTDVARAALGSCTGAALVDAATLLGVPLGLVGEHRVDPGRSVGVLITDIAPAAVAGAVVNTGPLADADADADGRGANHVRSPRRAIEQVDHPDDPTAVRGGPPLRVLDLSGLWAGPLCAHILGRAGAQVTKVESAARPDASRTGSPGLFAHLNAGKQHLTVDLATGDGRDELRRLIRAADVVLESSRPRAMEQLGIVSIEELGSAPGPRLWVSITGHGRASDRVAFGDDAAASGGLVAWVGGEPRFAGDALADPLAGLAAAAACLEALAASRTALIDVALADAAASALAVVPPGATGSAGSRRPDGSA